MPLYTYVRNTPHTTYKHVTLNNVITEQQGALQLKNSDHTTDISVYYTIYSVYHTNDDVYQ